MLKSHSFWYKLSLCSQLSAGIVLVGWLTLLLSSGLACLLLRGTFFDQQGTELAAQAQALSQLISPQRMQAAMPLLSADVPQRHVMLLDTQGRLAFASPMPTSTLQTLEQRARQDLTTAPTVTREDARWDWQGDQIIADVLLSSGNGQTRGVLLLATDQQIATLQWERALILVLLSTAVATALALLSSFFAARFLVHPVHVLTAVARQIATGDYTSRMRPMGPIEMQQLSRAFNHMLEEVVRQRQVEHDLLTNIAHELAAPLSLIRGYAEALSDGMIEEMREQQSALRAIGAEATRLSRLSGDLLDMALIQTGRCQLQVEVVLVPAFLAGLAQRFSREAHLRGIRLDIQVIADLPSLRTDGLRLEQVFVNLLTNALRYTPRGGTITLRASREQARLCLQVADTGQGIAAEQLERIWEPFYQVEAGRDRREGTAGVGLGLAICRTTITWLGGRIGVESLPGTGTTFTLWLPFQQDQVRLNGVSPPGEMDASRGSESQERLVER